MRCQRTSVRFAAIITCAALGACGGMDGGAPYRQVPGGSADRGKLAIHNFGCGSCHMIPGIGSAQGVVGPPLSHFGRRVYIAGEVTNTDQNLIRWLKDPQSIEPGTVMPNLGVTDQVARDMAAYLYTLR